MKLSEYANKGSRKLSDLQQLDVGQALGGHYDK